MKRSLTKQQLEFILGQIKYLEKDHPKAEIIYDIESNRVIITYPLSEELK